MKFTIKHHGDFRNMESFLRAMEEFDIPGMVQPYAEAGVRALEQNTPRDSGLASRSWGYTIEDTRDNITIVWHNYDIENGFPVAIALQYGYSTGTGGYVAGRDYINPTMQPIFDEIELEVMKAVISA